MIATSSVENGSDPPAFEGLLEPPTLATNGDHDLCGDSLADLEERCVDADPNARFIGCTAAPRTQHRPLGWLLITASITVAAVGVARVISRRRR